MIRGSVAHLGTQLAAYCEAVGGDATQMKTKLKSRSHSSGCREELTFLTNIGEGLTILNEQCDELAELVMGHQDSRLNNTTIEELLYCAAALFEANADVIRRAKGAIVTATGNSNKKQKSNCFDERVKENEINGIESDMVILSDSLNESIVHNNDISFEDEDGGSLNGPREDLAPPGNQRSPAASERDGGDDPGTPTLEAWQLSHATRSIIDQQKYLSKFAAKSPESTLFRKSDKLQEAMFKYHNSGMTGPDVKGLSPSVHFKISTSFEEGSPIRAESEEELVLDENVNCSAVSRTPFSAHSKSNRFETPVDEARLIMESHASHVNHSTITASPSTPTLGSSPLKTCEPINAAVHVRSEASLHDLSTMSSLKRDGDCELSDEVYEINEKDLSTSKNDDSVIDPSTLSSPPKAVKVLNPRRNQHALSAGSDSGWIPMVEEQEWKQAPSFMKMQFELQALNVTLRLLNEFIASNSAAADGGFSKRLETFSFDEIIKIVGNRIEPAPIRVVVLGLVHFKRLDVGTENSVKVYKVRRFY